jgi:glucose-1-phosphate thymidylyltransferase
VRSSGVSTVTLQTAAVRGRGATVFAYQVRDPERYGVVSFDDDGHAMVSSKSPRHRNRIGP